MIDRMIFGCCFLMTIIISATSINTSFIYAFQPHYYQPPSHRRQQQHGVGNYLQREHYHRRSFQLFNAKTDPSIIAYNRQYLIDTLGFSEEKLDKIETSAGNGILTLEIGVLDERVNWLKDRLNLKGNEIKKIAQRQPTILGMKSISLKSKLDFLQTRLLLDDAALQKMILRNPSIIMNNIEDNIEPTLNYLQQKLLLDDKALKKLVLSANLIHYSIDDNIEPTLDWLQQRLGLDDTELSKMVKRLPQILGYSILDNMDPKLDWLQQRLGLDDTELSKMIQIMPAILGYSILDNMEPKLNWLQQRLSLTDEELSKLIQKLPSIFCYNIDTNLEPTINFYINALGDESKALAFVTRDPSSLGRSLEKRLKPRLEEAKQAGVIVDSTCLQIIMKYTEDQWAKRLLKEMK